MRIIKILLTLTILLTSLSGCSVQKENKEPEKLVFQSFSYEVLKNNTYSNATPITYVYVDEEKIIAKQGEKIDSKKANDNGYWWVASETNPGSPKKEVGIYKYTYDIDGNLLSKTLVPGSYDIKEAESTIYSYYGSIEPGAIFYPETFTKFGYNCGGCYIQPEGYTILASGIEAYAHKIRQFDGTWLDGITYEGYYMIAMHTQMPICTIVEVSGHSFRGEGIEPGVPFRAIVADRGVAVNHVDFFAGDEHNLSNIVQTKRKQNIKITIISLGKKVKSAGRYVCQV